MFKNREAEIALIQSCAKISDAGCNGILIYGRRRVGKSSLVREAMKGFDGVFIEFESAETLFSVNMKRLSKLISNMLGLSYIVSIVDLYSLMEILDSIGKRVVLFIDEYQYLKKGYKDGNLDSIFQIAIDQLSNRLTIILCGSYVTLMSELNNISSPLFGRFRCVIHLRPFDYLESSRFYPDVSTREKIEYYSIFGGMPFVLEKIDPDAGVEKNIRQLLLDPSSSVFVVIAETLLKEIFKIEQAEAILELIGNGKAKNSMLASSLNTSTSAIAQEVNRLLRMEILEKRVPINKKDDSKKTFYEISDNLLRFFYAYIFPHVSELNRFGADFVWSRYIGKSLDTFISRRFEGIVSEYLAYIMRKNADLDFLDIGTFWYDLPDLKRNGEFDNVIETVKGYIILESKFLSNPMDAILADEERSKIENISGLGIRAIGFVSSSGFESAFDDSLYISGDDIYNKSMIEDGNPIRSFLEKR